MSQRYDGILVDKMAERVDVLIVGGGISGISLASRLVENVSVAVAEAEEELGMHATGRSAALLVEAYGPPDIRRLTKLSRGFFEAPPAGFADAPLARRRGALVYATEAHVEKLRGEYEMAQRMAEVLWVEGDAVLEQCPLLRPGVAAAGFIEPNALDLDANALLHGFASAAGGVERTS
jgi:D-arginine dehydrogenase